MPDSFANLIARSVGARLLSGLLVCMMLVVLDISYRQGVTPVAQAVWSDSEKESAGRATGALVSTGRGYIPMPPDTPAAHASNLLAMPATHPAAMMAFWFAGARESAPDVQIAASNFDRATQQWSQARWVVNRHALAEPLGFGVRRLGNPVAWLDPQGRIHLFVVATGWGGWAAGRIVHLRQHGQDADFANLSFDVVRVLPLSWLWNTSFLVRTAPLPLQDGGMVLPVHFELGIKYPVALRFDAGGEFKGMVRISSRKYLLQPTLLMASESHWLALMRDHSPVGRVAAAQTTDGGQHWSDLPDLALNNPDSSVAGVAVAPGKMFLAHNSSLHDRRVLDLSASVDGPQWALAQGLEKGASDDAEYSYPALAWSENSLWVTYTDHRKRIAWQRFSFAAEARLN